MRKNMKALLAACMSFSMIVTGFSSGIIAGTSAKAAGEVTDDTVLTKVLGADDISLRYKWDDKSNVGEEREVKIAGGTSESMKVKDNGTMRQDLSSQYLAENEMGLGINLGNTMEANPGIANKATTTEAAGFETSWGAPITTQEYMNSVHSYGINTIRIPVAWSNMDPDDGTYKINEKYLGRVEEIVNYALNNGMYVIINDHWDSQWWGQFGACKRDADGNKVANEEMRAEAWKRYEAYWTQISDRFKNYSDHLIFEGANEELGDRLNDPICSNGYATSTDPNDKAVAGNLTTDELYATANKINQKFVEIVRGTGDNNKYRHLLIPGYGTDIEATADDRFVMPKDTVAENGTNKLFLSVHYYTPSNFCLDKSEGKYTVRDQKATKEYFAKLAKFKDAGYATIVGECGVCEPTLVRASVTQWFVDTFTEAQKYDAVPCLWDTGAYFDRTAAKLKFKDIAVMYNTINGTSGDTSMETVTGNPNPEKEEDSNAVKIGEYIDMNVWNTKGIHAYLSYQTAAWDYRDAFKPMKDYKGGNAFEYIKACGNEADKDTVVKDVVLNKDGEYTVSIDGIDLSGANYFSMLSISTDLNRNTYANPAVKCTDVTVKIDGKEVNSEKVTLPYQDDAKNPYYNFMAINKWDKKNDYPLQDLSDNEKITLPSKSVEITFKITGLSKALSDLKNGKYIDPQTDEAVKNTDVVVNDTTTAKPSSNRSKVVGLKKNATFTNGQYKYKVTKTATTTKKGEVSLIALTKKGTAAKKLSVATTVKNGKASYTVNAIGSKVFKNAKATSVTLSKNIKKIPASAFANCKKLNTLTVNTKLSSVTKNAFKGCKLTIKVKGTKSNCKANVAKLKKSGYKKFK